MTQLNVKDSLKAFGIKGDEAILKKISNYIHDKRLSHVAGAKCHKKRENGHSDI